MSFGAGEQSMAQRVALLSPSEREEALDGIDKEALLWDPKFWLRPSQLRPLVETGWNLGILQAGRGAGKTRVLSEWTRKKVKELPAGSRGALVARTAADVRDVLVNGASGILAMSPEDERPTWEPSKRLLTFPNGTTCLCFTSEAPDALRGPQFHFLVADEIASWLWLPDESGLTAWDNARLATRLGEDPQILAATTPRRTPFMRALMELTKKAGTLLVRGSTRDNEANLSQVYLDTVYGLYGGTRLAQQELEGELLEDAEHALWKQDLIDSVRLPSAPEHTLRIVGVDPSVAERPTDECGIVVVGSTAERELHKRHAYVLEDASILGAPSVWAQRVVDVCERWSVNVVVAEGNQGAALVADAIRSINPNLRVEIVHARVNKATRAEPVAVRYDKRVVHHVGVFPELESQMTSWEPSDSKAKSPDRIDALVWAMTALLIKPIAGMMGGTLRSSGVTSRRLVTGSLTSGIPGVGVGMNVTPDLSEVLAARPRSARVGRGRLVVRSVAGRGRM